MHNALGIATGINVQETHQFSRRDRRSWRTLPPEPRQKKT